MQQDARHAPLQTVFFESSGTSIGVAWLFRVLFEFRGLTTLV